MIHKLLNRYTDKRATKKAQRIASEREVMNRWDHQYFENIIFPVLIIDNSSYGWISVSDIEEYFYDVDINSYGMNKACELIDSKGDVYNFREIEEGLEGLEGFAWIPDRKTGITNIDTVKQKLRPRYIPVQKNKFENSSSIQELIKLLLTNQT